MHQSELDEERYRLAYRLVVKHYIKETLRNWKYSVPGLLLPAIGSIFSFYIPALFLSKIAGKAISEHSSLADLAPMIGLFVGSWIIGELMWRIGVHFGIVMEIRGVYNLFHNGLDWLTKRDLRFFHDNFAGSLTKRTLDYAHRYIDVMDIMTYNVLSNLIPAIFAVILLCTYSIWLGLLLSGSVLLAILIILPLIRRRQKLVAVREIASNAVSGHVADVYGNIDAIKAHASEEREQSLHMDLVRDYAKKMKKTWDYQNLRIDSTIAPLYVSITASGLLLSIYLANKGVIEYAVIIVVYAYYAQITRYLWEFNGIYRRLESALSTAAQYTELLLEEPRINDVTNPIKPTNITGSISFDQVHFAYEEDSQKLFSHFSLNIKAGEKIGLVGRSGSGKTSITKLLLRFVDIDEGAITIDGIKINEMTQQDLRSLIAYVPQEPVMFHRSIHDNIAYGKPNASREEVIEAAKKAHADEFVKELPLGYETLVGERGIKLSGGQRQRIAIARAILKEAPILLLDEATSALDSESEVLIQDALQELMKKKTAIVIAHRLSTVQNMDRIVVLDKGEIIEQGAHSELIKKKGIYADLWKHQSGGFLED